jgi:acyl-homoserine lactone acylase PvdQ
MDGNLVEILPRPPWRGLAATSAGHWSAFSPAHGERYEELAPDAVIAVLANPDKDLFGEHPVAGRDALLLDAILSARKELEQRLGAEPSKWTWGPCTRSTPPCPVSPPWR